MPNIQIHDLGVGSDVVRLSARYVSLEFYVADSTLAEMLCLPAASSKTGRRQLAAAVLSTTYGLELAV